MRLTDLFESPTIWYHGTPDGQDFTGSFESRTVSTGFITDPEKYQQLQTEMEALHGVDQDAYFKVLDQAGKLKVQKSVRKPIFFSNKSSVANTYADDARSFDYQAADPKVISTTIDDAPTLKVNAHGQNFRGIEVNSVISALVNSGIDQEKATAVMGHFSDNISAAGNKISTDRLAVISQMFDFSIVDVHGVKDNYNGGGPAGIVRMVFDPSLVHIQA
jgi:hypothetical protein